MRYLILFIFGFSTLLFSGCADENPNAVFGAHPDNWYNDHPGDIERTIESFIAECGGCHGLDLMGSGGAPSCFSTTFNGRSCHAGGPAPHPLDGSFLNADSHGPVAKSDLTVCQACHSDNPTGGAGSFPQFNVGIDRVGGVGCEACHTPFIAHPDIWAGPANDRYHYSAGNIQQACTLCHGAALTSCVGCHAEVVSFTLDCTYCHDQPPAVSHATSPALTEPTVADISAHDVCVTCHGMKESAAGGTFSNVSNYGLFDKQTDTIGDHWDGNINMNSDTAYNENTGGCDNTACHGGVAPYTLPDSGFPVVLGAYGTGVPHPLDGSFLNADSHGPVAKSDLTVCQECHSNNPTGGPGSNPQFNVGIFGGGCEDCHGANYAHPNTWAGPGTRFHYSAGNIQQACTLCHGAALDGVGGVAISCVGCHVEVVNFTLDCTYCHDQPPAVSHATSPALTEPTVADIMSHDVCVTCHGMKESATGGTFSNVANYALFDKLTDIIGDHWDGNINMNSDTAYNENTGGCDAAGCHGGVAPYTLPDSGFPVVLGAYGGAGTIHPAGQDWLLPDPPNPNGHVAAADAACVSCHTQTGGGQDPACQDCHVQGDPFVLLDCTSCHSAPPSTASIDPLDRPDRQGAHNGHDGFTTSTQDCSACHQGGGTGELSHYDRIDQTTPDYPADVVLASSFDSISHGAATYSNGVQTCSGINCHGGLITPNWYTGFIDVNTQCISCHNSGTSEANSYNSGEHTKHLVDLGYSCTVCHNTDKLAINHFTNLANPPQWLDTAGETVDGGTTSIPEGDYDEVTNSCTPACHGTETW